MIELKSTYFTLDEFTSSQIAIRKNIDNTPTDLVIVNLNWLCSKILDPLRGKLNKPIVISSGYRCPKLNLEAGGSLIPPSQHTMGKAADLIIPGMKPKEVMDYIIEQTKLPFDQLIYEYKSWVHISYDHDKVIQRGSKLQIEIDKDYEVYIK